jgi:epoxide hydrolase 4
MGSSGTLDGFAHNEIRLKEVNLHYVRQGKKGAALLLLHEPDGFWWDWSRNIEALSDYFDVIVPDLRGCGKSEKPAFGNGEHYKIDRIVNDVAQLMQALEISKVYVVGHGWSSMVVHKLIRSHPDLVRRAAMLNAALPGFEQSYFTDSDTTRAWYAAFWRSDLAVSLIGSNRSACEAFVAYRLSQCGAHRNGFDDRDRERYVDNLMAPDNLHALQSFYRANLYPNAVLWDDMDKIISHCNVTFLQGLKDRIFPAEWVSLATRWYSRGNFEYAPDAGHFLMREEPEWLVHCLRLLKA